MKKRARHKDARLRIFDADCGCSALIVNIHTIQHWAGHLGNWVMDGDVGCSGEHVGHKSQPPARNQLSFQYPEARVRKQHTHKDTTTKLEGRSRGTDGRPLMIFSHSSVRGGAVIIVESESKAEKSSVET